MSIQEHCARYGVTIRELKSKTRITPVVKAKKSICLDLWRRGWFQHEIAQVINTTQQNVSYLISNN